MLGGGPRCFLALRYFVAFSLHRRPFLWAGLARLGRGPALPAATTVPRLTASPLPSITCVDNPVQAAAIPPCTFTLEAVILKRVISRVHDGDYALGLDIMILVTHSMCGKKTTVASDKGCANGCADLVSHLLSGNEVCGEVRETKR